MRTKKRTGISLQIYSDVFQMLQRIAEHDHQSMTAAIQIMIIRSYEIYEKKYQFPPLVQEIVESGEELVE
jgi:hypothetical protein